MYLNKLLILIERKCFIHKDLIFVFFGFFLARGAFFLFYYHNIISRGYLGFFTYYYLVSVITDLATSWRFRRHLAWVQNFRNLNEMD